MARTAKMAVMTSSADGARAIDRRIAALAVPALGALLAEPAFLAVDTAMVGHLGAVPLAAIGIAATVLQTAVGLLIFLAYATTPIVARRVGAGDPAGAVRAGVDGLWLAAGLGVALVALGIVAGPAAVGAFGAGAAVTSAASGYLGVSIWGMPALLVLLAATGLFRGLRDTRTPFLIAGVGFGANALLNAALIYGAGWGLIGSAVGTVIAQWGMAIWAVAIVLRHARAHQVALRPTALGLRASASAGSWLLVRTIALRIALVGTVAAATAQGTVALGATQAVFAVFTLVSLGLDALAIAAQTLVGGALGAGDAALTRAVVRRTLRLAALVGTASGLELAAASPVLALSFTADTAVRAAILPGLLVVAASGPVAAVVFALDGILIGAGDGRYLALTGLAQLAVVIPLLVVVATADLDAAAAVGAVQLVFSGAFLLARLLALGLRARGSRWLVTGAAR